MISNGSVKDPFKSLAGLLKRNTGTVRVLIGPVRVVCRIVWGSRWPLEVSTKIIIRPATGLQGLVKGSITIFNGIVMGPHAS